jgi:predicted thioesterase
LGLPAADFAADAAVGTTRTVHYRVRRRDLASWIYRCLGWSRRKPAVFATARLLWLAELAAMPAIPGVSLGYEQVIKHLAPTVRGVRVTVTAECTDRRGRDWQWTTVVRDEHQVLGRCTLWFVGDVDRKRYTARRLAPKLARRPIRIVCWLALLDALTLTAVLAVPAQAAYVWQHHWMLGTEITLTVGWLVALTGLPGAISDWLTVRRSKEIPRWSISCERR